MHTASRVTIALICALTFTVIAPSATITNNSFEQPVTPGFVYDPIDPTGGWTFLFRTGVAANTFFTPPPPNGNQAAFIQQFSDEGSNLSAISQALTGVATSPSILTFFIAQRPGFTANPVQVLYGSQNLGTFTPSGTAFQLVTINFTPSSTTGTLVFRSAATTAGDIDSAIDNVSLVASGQTVPEPATLWVVGAGMLLLSFAMRKLRV